MSDDNPMALRGWSAVSKAHSMTVTEWPWNVRDRNGANLALTAAEFRAIVKGGIVTRPGLVLVLAENGNEIAVRRVRA